VHIDFVHINFLLGYCCGVRSGVVMEEFLIGKHISDRDAVPF